MFLRQICFSMVALLYHRSGSQQVRDYFGEDMLLIALLTKKRHCKLTFANVVNPRQPSHVATSFYNVDRRLLSSSCSSATTSDP